MFSSRSQDRQEAGRGAPRHGGWHRDGIRSVATMRQLIETVAAAMTAARFGDKEIFGVRLAMEEAIVNGMKHGHRGDPSRTVRVRWRVEAGRVLIEVEDEGPGFDPHQVPDPLAPENLEKSSGRGLLLMRTYMTWIRYNECGNQVTLCKQRSSEESSPAGEEQV